MATSNTNQNSIPDEYIRELLECPVCKETIKSVPVYQCTNGHVICKYCIEKLNNCPICRNDSAPARNLQIEKIVQRLEGIQPENEGPATGTPNLQKWGKGSVRSYGTINGPNQMTSIEINPQTNPRQATPRQATPRQATPRQATPRQILSRQANNQDVEAGLRREPTCERVNNFVIFLCIAILFISCFGLVISFILFACGVEQDPPKLFLFSFGFFLISSGLIGCLDKFQQSTH
jgi:hypothetical protein